MGLVVFTATGDLHRWQRSVANYFSTSGGVAIAALSLLCKKVLSGKNRLKVKFGQSPLRKWVKQASTATGDLHRWQRSVANDFHQRGRSHR